MNKALIGCALQINPEIKDERFKNFLTGDCIRTILLFAGKENKFKFENRIDDDLRQWMHAKSYIIHPDKMQKVIPVLEKTFIEIDGKKVSVAEYLELV